MNVQIPFADAEQTARSRWRSHAWLVTAAIAAALPAALFHDSYLMGTFASIVIFGIVLVGLDLVIGYGELLAFSHGAFFALGAYVMGVLSARYGVPLLAGAAIAILTNAVLAVLIGAATLRLQGYYLAVATLGFGIIVIEMLGAFVEVTGGWSGLRGMAPTAVFGYRVTEDVEFYAIGAVVLIIGLALARNIIASRFGRAVRASGSDALAAEMLGIATARVRLNLFVIGAIYASVAGSLYAAFLRVITPANFDVVTSIDMILMLFLGGKETLWGSILGATILRLLPELVEGLNDYKTLIQGVLFVAVLMFFPRGLVGLLFRLPGPWRAPSSRATPETDGPTAKPVATRLATVQFDFLPAFAVSNKASGDAPIIRVDGLTKRFGGVAAVSDVSFSVKRGQLKAVIGPNGAGKTTLFNLLTGVLEPDSGSLQLYGEMVAVSRPHGIARRGVARTFQTPRLFANMTVLENVVVGRHTRLRASLLDAIFPGRRTRIEEQAAVRNGMQLLARLGLAHLAHENIDSLAFGQRRLLEVARCLAMEPQILLLDEPAAGLNDTEKGELSKLLRSLRDAGITLLLVEHDMRLVMGVAEEIVVLDHGGKIAEGTPTAIRSDKAVLDAYLGAEVQRARG